MLRTPRPTLRVLALALALALATGGCSSAPDADGHGGRGSTGDVEREVTPLDRPDGDVSEPDGLAALATVETDDEGCVTNEQVVPAALALELAHVEDLDGDGTEDTLETWTAGAERRRFVRLVLGSGGTGALLEEFESYEVAATVDLDGDGSRELLVEQGGATWTTGFLGHVDGCRILAVTGPDGPEPYYWGAAAHSMGCPLCTATITCAPVGDGRTALVEGNAEPFDEGAGSVSPERIDAWLARGDQREWRWQRRVLTYGDGALTLADEQGQVDRHPDVPADVLRNDLSC